MQVYDFPTSRSLLWQGHSEATVCLQGTWLDHADPSGLGSLLVGQGTTHSMNLPGVTHPCGGFLSSQPALMTGAAGRGPPGSPSMGYGRSSGVRRLLGRDELRLLVCHPPLWGRKEGVRAQRKGLGEWAWGGGCWAGWVLTWGCPHRRGHSHPRLLGRPQTAPLPRSAGWPHALPVELGLPRAPPAPSPDGFSVMCALKSQFTPIRRGCLTLPTTVAYVCSSVLLLLSPQIPSPTTTPQGPAGLESQGQKEGLGKDQG